MVTADANLEIRWPDSGDFDKILFFSILCICERILGKIAAG